MRLVFVVDCACVLDAEIAEAVVESLTDSRQQLLLALGDCLEKLQAQQVTPCLG